MAIARRALGDIRGAIDTLEPLDGTRAAIVSHNWAVYDWLRCRVLLAEWYRQAGRPNDAIAVAREVRALLAVAEPGHPLLARLTQLGM